MKAYVKSLKKIVHNPNKKLANVMLQYLIILLDDSSTSYCHYDSQRKNRLIGLSDLAEGIKFAMKENLMIQFIYPDFDLPTEYP